MNDMDIIHLTSGLLQFGVAWYALRLGRLCKSTLVGWLLFGALSLLALLSLFLAVKPFGGGAQWGIKVDIIYSLISLLLLAAMMCFYSGLKNLLQEEGAARRALDKWELQVREQWVELIKTNEKLRQTVNRLETEIAERKQAQEQGEKNLQALLAASRQNEQALPPAATGLQTEAAERKPAPTPEPAEKNGESPLTAPPKNGEESRPVVAGFDTEIVAQKPAPEPAEKNGEHPLTAPRKNREESWQTALVPDRKIAGRKPSRTRRKNPAKTR
ncbi:MAG: hypothetical protein ABSC01_03155 [Verrucomicrobiota bacterium]|jgi:hypothetical protein